MPADFFTRLRTAQPALTRQLTKVARFVEARYVDAAFMSTRELAAASEVSLATVVRFARALGYSDFNAFRAAVQEQVNVDLSGVERLKSLPASSNTSPAALLRRIVDEDTQTLQRLAHDFSEAQFERFVDALCGAGRVLVVGFRYVAALASYTGYSLNKIRPGVETCTQADSTLYDRVMQLGPHDVILAIGFARYPSDLVALLQFAHAQDRRMICITDSTLSPLLPLSEASLFAKGSIRDFVGSLAAAGALINCIASELARRLGERALQRLETAERAAQEGGLYAGGHVPRTWRNNPALDPDAGAGGHSRHGD